jgi:hypothetical protein
MFWTDTSPVHWQVQDGGTLRRSHVPPSCRPPTSNNRLPTAARQPCSATRLPDRSACTCRRPLRHLKHDSSSTDLLSTVSTLPTFNDSSTTSSASRARYVDLLGFMHKLSASFFLNYFYGFNLFRRSALHVFSALLIPPPRHARGLGNANT